MRVALVSAGENLAEALKNCEGQSGSSPEGNRGCDGDGGDIMVGPRVYVDEVGSEEGVAANLNGEAVCGELVKSGLALEREMSSAEERGDEGEVDESTSQKISVLVDPESDGGVEGSLVDLRSSGEQTQVLGDDKLAGIVNENETRVTVSEGNANPKNEAPGSVERSAPCIERDLISATDVVHEQIDTNAHENSGSKEDEVTDVEGVAVTEEVTYSENEVAETDAFDGNQNCSSYVEATDKITENCGNETTEVASSPNIEVVALNGTVPLSASGHNLSSEKDELAKADLVCETAGIDSAACAYSELSIEQKQFSTGILVPVDEKFSIPSAGAVKNDGLSEILVSSERSQNSKVGRVNESLEIDGAINVQSESYVEQTRIAEIKDVKMIEAELQGISDMQTPGADCGVKMAPVLDSKVGVPSVDDHDKSYSVKDRELKGNTVSGSTEKKDSADAELSSSGDDGLCVDTNSSKESDPKDECLGFCVLDENGSFPEKDSSVENETMARSPRKDSIINTDQSVTVESLPIEDQTFSLPGKELDVTQENASVQDEKQETVVHLDQSKNGPVVEEMSNLGDSDSVSVVDFTVGPLTAYSSAALNNGGDHDSPSLSETNSPLQDGNQDLDGPVLPNQVCLQDGDKTKDTHVHNVKIHQEVENQVIRAKIEPSKAITMGTSAPEAILSHPIHTRSMTISEEDGNSETQDEVVKDNISPPDESNLEGSEIQGMGGKDGFLTSEVDLSVGQCAEVGEQIIGTEHSGIVHGWQEMQDEKQQKSFDDSIVGQGVEVEIGMIDAEQFSSHAAQDIQTEDWAASSEQQKSIRERSVGQEPEFEEQTIGGEHFSLHAVQIIRAKDQPTDAEQLKSTEEKVIKWGDLKPGSSGGLHRATNELPPDSEGEFSVSDLVWGKVRSHPWWPGQIFDPSDASEYALKYYKKDCYLVAYFGDQTFAWNDASLLKPFRTHFSHIEKLSNSEVFQNAVDCALDEVSRRVELGLACSCISREAFNKIKCPFVENTGIRHESSRRDGVEKSAIVNSFEPVKLVEYINELAQFPSVGGDKLELVIAKAQLLASNRLKGYSQLPEFQFCRGLLVDDSDAPLPEDNIRSIEVNPSDMGKVKGQNSSFHKRKHDLQDSIHPMKKERSMSELMCRALYSADGEDESELVLSSSIKKQGALDACTDGLKGKEKRKSIVLGKVSQTTSLGQKQSFKVGECISRVASQLTRSPSTHKCDSDESNFDILEEDPDEMGIMLVPAESSSPDEILSQLDLAARDPMKGYSFLENSVISFLYDYRNYIVASGRECMDDASGGRKRKSPHSMIRSPETFEFEDMNDCYWTDMVIQNSCEEKPSRRGRKKRERHSVVPKPEGCCLYGNYEMAAGRPAHDLSPTELILNFSEVDLVPSEMNLNNIFRRFGPLREFDTEVDMLTTRAKVVFKRCSDAEVAFTSAGAFSIFGSAAVNYQLNYSPSMSFKSSPLAIMEGQGDEV